MAKTPGSLVLKNNLQLALMLGWQDVRQTYRRSPIGPFWVTITTGILITTIGFVFGILFKIPYKDYLPYLALGILIWNFVSAVIAEASTMFVNAAELVKQIKLPIYVHVIRLMWRSFVVFLHNIVIIPVLFLILQVPISWTVILSLFGLVIVLANLSWIVVALGIVATRYRDFNQLTTSFLAVFFYVTPIMWKKEGLDFSMASVLVEFNPFSVFLALIREPFLGQVPTLQAWLSGLAYAVVGWLIAAFIARRYSHRVVYWL